MSENKNRFNLGKDLSSAGTGRPAANDSDAHLAVGIELVGHLQVGGAAGADGTSPVKPEYD